MIAHMNRSDMRFPCWMAERLGLPMPVATDSVTDTEISFLEEIDKQNWKETDADVESFSKYLESHGRDH